MKDARNVKNVDSPKLNYVSFCTGVGWLDISFQLACEFLGIRTRPVFACEWEAFAAQCLRSRMEESSLECCPIWCGDLRDINAGRFRGVVDAAVFGFPCQDISCAGKGAGIHGERSGVFFDILDKCCEMGCDRLFMENVSAITTRGMDAVLGALAERGFDAEWSFLKAAQVKASHERERWFCVAYRPQSRSRRVPESARRDHSADACRFGAELANTDSQRRQQIARGSFGNEGQDERWSKEHDYEFAGCSEGVANTAIGGLGELRESPRGHGQPDRSGIDVGNAEHSQAGNGDTGSEGGSPRRKRRRVLGSADAGGVLVDATCERGGISSDHTGSKGQGVQQPYRRDSQLANASLSIFAPGPQSEHWRSIIDHYPHLAPAIEPGFRVLVDGGTAYVVDEARADQLRCSGNGVVAIQGAVAYVGLMRRLGLVDLLTE